MKVLLDQGLPRSAAQLLRDVGIDSIHVGEINFSTESDSAVLSKAREQQRIVVTLDADFHALLATTSSSAPSVIRIRIEKLQGPAAADLIRKVLIQCHEDLLKGAIVTVQSRGIRIRRLPIGP